MQILAYFSSPAEFHPYDPEVAEDVRLLTGMLKKREAASTAGGGLL
jgi:hypothetical protein